MRKFLVSALLAALGMVLTGCANSMSGSADVGAGQPRLGGSDGAGMTASSNAD